VEQLLEKLFESVPKARVLRLLMRNPEERFGLEEIVSRSQVRVRTARNELKKLMRLGLINLEVQRVESPKKRRGKPGSKRVAVYVVNTGFIAFTELRDLIVRASVAPRKKLFRQLNGLGRVKLAVLSGIFINSGENSRTDLLVVGDNLNRRRFIAFLSNTESELGKSVRYTLMDTDEFKYRTDMYDRFIRDILEYPHEKLINKLNI
jgi:hypothetical protein